MRACPCLIEPPRVGHTPSPSGQICLCGPVSLGASSLAGKLSLSGKLQVAHLKAQALRATMRAEQRPADAANRPAGRFGEIWTKFRDRQKEPLSFPVRSPSRLLPFERAELSSHAAGGSFDPAGQREVCKKGPRLCELATLWMLVTRPRLISRGQF